MSSSSSTRQSSSTQNNNNNTTTSSSSSSSWTLRPPSSAVAETVSPDELALERSLITQVKQHVVSRRPGYLIACVCFGGIVAATAYYWRKQQGSGSGAGGGSTEHRSTPRVTNHLSGDDEAWDPSSSAAGWAFSDPASLRHDVLLLEQNADAAYRDKDYQLAHQYLSQALLLCPSSSNLYLNRGNLSFLLHDYQHTLTDIEQCLQICNTHHALTGNESLDREEESHKSRALFLKGRALMMMKKYDTAIEALTAALQTEQQQSQLGNTELKQITRKLIADCNTLRQNKQHQYQHHQTTDDKPHTYAAAAAAGAAANSDSHLSTTTMNHHHTTAAANPLSATRPGEADTTDTTSPFLSPPSPLSPVSPVSPTILDSIIASNATAEKQRRKAQQQQPHSSRMRTHSQPNNTEAHDTALEMDTPTVEVSYAPRDPSPIRAPRSIKP